MLVDSHCHLDFPDFADDLDGVVGRARAAGVGRIVTISTRVKRHADLLAIAERFPDVYCSLGTHPLSVREEPDITTADLIDGARHPKVVAIGEAGLDYFYDNSPRDAAGAGASAGTSPRRARPACRWSSIRARPTTTWRRSWRKKPGRAPSRPCCIATPAVRTSPRRAIALGLSISFTGILTFKKSEDLRAIARSLPADRIMVETDAPYLAPGKFRGKRNEPAYVVETAKVLAETRGVSFDEIARMTSDNFFRLFAKVPRPSAAAAGEFTQSAHV